MSKFKDREGREWVIDITFADFLRVQKETGVNLRNLLNDKMQPYLELITDPEKFGVVLYSLCSDQAKARGVSFDGLAQSLDSESFECCQEAFEEAVVNFSGRRRKEVVKLLTAKVEEMRPKLMAKAMEEIEAAMLTSSRSGSSAPGSSESTPAPLG